MIWAFFYRISPKYMISGVYLGVFLIGKEFLCGDFAVQQAVLLAFGHTERCYHRVYQFERSFGLVAENRHPFVEFFLVVIADDVGL